MEGVKGIAILGCGNIGSAIARGILAAKLIEPAKIVVTKRNQESLREFAKEGFVTLTDNKKAVDQCNVVIVCVTPQALNGLLDDIKSSLKPDKFVISIVSGEDKLLLFFVLFFSFIGFLALYLLLLLLFLEST
jgi:pyrroline-5-carboxylate reductase